MNFFTELSEGLAIAFDAVRANKLRSILTTLGIVVGIVTVTLMGSALQGVKKSFYRSISVIGTDVLYVQRFAWLSDEEWWKMRNRREITMAQARAVMKECTLAAAVAPIAERVDTVKTRDHSADGVYLTGTTEQRYGIGGGTIGQGRYFTAEESEGGRPVCVLGYDVAEGLFPGYSALGQRVMIGGHSMEVVGVLEKQGSFLGIFSLDLQASMPLRQFQSVFDRAPDLSIQVKVANLDQLEDAKEEVRGIMRKARKLAPGAPDDFSINQQDAFVKVFNRVGGMIAGVGLFITGLSLFVGGIGIMNIMLVSVTERTREIGIRKALGAKRRTILLQFLTEAAMICLFGGLIALAIAFPITLLMSRSLPTELSASVALTAIGVSLLTGVMAGFLPAWRAARMSPVDALRQE